MITDEELEQLAHECCDELRQEYCIGKARYEMVLYYLKKVNEINKQEIDNCSDQIDNLQVNTDRDY